MSRIRISGLAATGLAVALTFAAATHVRADQKTFNAIEAAIHKSAHIPLAPASASQPNSVYLQLKQSLQGGTTQAVRAVQLHTNKASNSVIHQMANAPQAWGSQFDWDRSQQAVLLGIVVNASDPLGVAINGLKKGDIVTILNPTGVCTFSQDDGHPFIASLVGDLLEGTQAVVDTFVGTEFDSTIQSVSTTLQNELKTSPKATKPRDPFGIQPGTSGFGLEEGGVVVMMPQAGGIYYSGDPNHRSIWATQPRGITAARGCPKYLVPRVPPPVKQGGKVTITALNLSTLPLFFVGHNAPNTGICTTDGTAYILAWDFAYGDNAGTYQLVVRVTQGSASTPVSVTASPAVAKKAKATR